MPFTKRRSDVPPDFFEAEAAGLLWLAAAGPDAAAVVEVLDTSREQITLAELTTAPPTPAAAEEFGRRLAVTHAAGAAAYGSGPPGREGDGYIGNLPLPLQTEDSWGVFFAEHRILHYARQARDGGVLDQDDVAVVERVCHRVAAGEFDDSRTPERIHGDLWTGNVIFTADGVTLIDPAAYGGRGLTDLGMLCLFGAPELETILAAYAEAADLPSGWREQIGLHQLHPLLVHCVSHGSAYGHYTMAVARRYD
ncbi:MAG: fructosamine kinase family protein [Propionibacteriaceae bacterium]